MNALLMVKSAFFTFILMAIIPKSRCAHKIRLLLCSKVAKFDVLLTVTHLSNVVIF